jgi:hypothetical protein
VSEPTGVITAPAAGGEIVRSPEDAALLGESFGTPVVDPAGLAAEQAIARRRLMFDNAGDRALTFVEGVTDAATLGLVRETGEEADLRRDVNSGEAIVGNIAGTLLGLGLGGPVKAVARAGEGFGRAAARTVLRQADDAILGKAAMEAGTGATAFGHSLMNTLIEDRDFSSEVILDEMKLGGVLGGVAGGAMGAFGKFAARAEVMAGKGLLGDMAPTLRALDEVTGAYDDALRTHSERLGGLMALRERGRLGPVSDGWFDVRRAAVRDAERARDALKAMDPAAALGGADPAAYKAFRKAQARYREAVRAVDEAMTPAGQELAQAWDLAKPTVIELNPYGKMMGDLEGLMRGADERQFASEMARRQADELAGNSAAPSTLDKTGAQSPQALRANSPEAPGDLAALNQLIDPAVPRGAEDVGQAFKTVVDELPLGRIEGKRAAIQANAAGREAAKQARLNRPAPAATSTVVEPLPLGARVGAEQKAAVAEAKAAEKAPTLLDPPKTVIDPLTDPNAGKDLLKEWYALRPHRIRPWEQAEARAQQALDDLYAGSNGRMDSARALGLVEKAGLEGSTDRVGGYLDQVWSLKRAGHFASQEARGVATPLREAAMDMVAGGVARIMTGSRAIGVGVALATQFLGYGGRLAAASGRMMQTAAGAVAKLMSSSRIRAGAVAASNQSYAYSDRGPIKDPVERIQEVQFLASNPDAIRHKVAQSFGDLGVADPDLLRAAQERAVNQVTQIAIRAPAIYFDKLGRPLSPPMGKMREFHEFENAMHDAQAILQGVATGSLTKPQADALKLGWTSLHMKITQEMLSDPAKLQALSRAQLRVVEMVTGLPLTGSSDPAFLARQAEAWIPATPAPAPAKPQAFNINPDGSPTPAQANASGRAPGN